MSCRVPHRRLTVGTHPRGLEFVPGMLCLNWGLQGRALSELLGAPGRPPPPIYAVTVLSAVNTTDVVIGLAVSDRTGSLVTSTKEIWASQG